MSKQDYSTHPTEALIRLYAAAASEHGEATGRAGNPAADRIAAIYREIRDRGPEHQKMLLPLLLSKDIGIRSWSSAHALEFEPRQGEAILSEIGKQQGRHAFSARMVLELWREGNLRFP